MVWLSWKRHGSLNEALLPHLQGCIYKDVGPWAGASFGALSTKDFIFFH